MFIVSLLLLASTFFIGAVWGCWIFLEGLIGLALLSGLWMLIYPRQAPRAPNTRTHLRRLNIWWHGDDLHVGHDGQVIRTILIMLAILAIVVGLFYLTPRIPSCAGIKPCTATTIGSSGAVAPAAEPARPPVVSDNDAAYRRALETAVALHRPARGLEDTTIVTIGPAPSVMYIVPSRCLIRWERVKERTWYLVNYQQIAGGTWHEDDNRPGNPDSVIEGNIASITLQLASGESAEIRLITRCCT